MSAMMKKIIVEYSAPASWDFNEEQTAKLIKLSVFGQAEKQIYPLSGQWKVEHRVIDQDIAVEFKLFLQRLSLLHKRPITSIGIFDI